MLCEAGSAPLLLASAELPEQPGHPAALGIPGLDLYHLHTQHLSLLESLRASHVISCSACAANTCWLGAV